MRWFGKPVQQHSSVFTCRGVCPSTSFRRCSVTGCPWTTSSRRMFSTSACLPEDRNGCQHPWKITELCLYGGKPGTSSPPEWYLTPAASYIVMSVKQRATANRELARPNSSPTAVVTACILWQVSDFCQGLLCTPKRESMLRCFTVHSAECDDGMPPESTMALRSQTPFLTRFVKTCDSSSTAQWACPDRDL